MVPLYRNFLIMFIILHEICHLVFKPDLYCLPQHLSFFSQSVFYITIEQSFQKIVECSFKLSCPTKFRIKIYKRTNNNILAMPVDSGELVLMWR